jgi:hypothetical protein
LNRRQVQGDTTVGAENFAEKIFDAETQVVGGAASTIFEVETQAIESATVDVEDGMTNEDVEMAEVDQPEVEEEEIVPVRAYKCGQVSIL